MRLSIIIPIYNSEKYLQNCLKSICQQITKEIEIILVNDASKDGSVKICNSFKKNFQNIKLINLKKIVVFLLQEILELRCLQENIYVL